MFSEFFAEFTNAAGLPEIFAEDRRQERYLAHVDALERCGSLFNLTAITDRGEAIRKHVIDSLYAAKAVSELSRGETVTLIDVGSGAGFPALPIATACDNVSVTALDSTAKKCGFISETAAACGVGIETIPERAEEAAERLRESFDFATARAVARLNILAELCSPFVKVGGYFIAMKGSASQEELSEAEHALKELSLVLERDEPYEIKDGGERHILIFRKTAPTHPRYPRKYAQIKKKPL